jgi:predicted lipid-binding transport protein (Tim44 family)
MIEFVSGLAGVVVCCGFLAIVLLVALVVWFWKRQPDQRSSANAPTPPIQSTIASPTAAAPTQPTAPQAPTPSAPPAPTAAPQLSLIHI